MLISFENSNLPGMFGYVQKGLKRNYWLPSVHRPTEKKIHNESVQKWIVPKYMYRKRLFPQFIAGSGYLLERKDAQCLLRTSQIVSIIHLEDVYITGLCAVKCHIRRINHEGFKARKNSMSNMVLSTSDILIHYVNESSNQYFHDQALYFFDRGPL